MKMKNKKELEHSKLAYLLVEECSYKIVHLQWLSTTIRHTVEKLADGNYYLNTFYNTVSGTPIEGFRCLKANKISSGEEVPSFDAVEARAGVKVKIYNTQFDNVQIVSHPGHALNIGNKTPKHEYLRYSVIKNEK